MKKLLLLAFAAFSINVASAQSTTMQIPTHATTITGPYNGVLPLTARLSVVNISNQSIDVQVARKVISEVAGSENVFCWTQCYFPNVDVSPDIETIAAGATNSMFYADYSPKGNAGKTTIRYSFFRANSPTPDSVHTTIVYDATTVAGVKGAFYASNAISMPSPNPANDMTTIGYNLPANARNSKIKLYNAIGGLVKEINLSDKQGAIMLVTSGLPSGIYFYTLQVDNRSLTTKKLVVKH
ncbi:T9SS type A sorting domain-containing protein [Adhaeribacter terreus]|uniref:T9SS type A sorting domain-containing protein n=1 Tax=Adhaeribacter terreus TaxID=529703 RepID=A0ABW0EEK7_9BACT